MLVAELQLWSISELSCCVSLAVYSFPVLILCWFSDFVFPCLFHRLFVRIVGRHCHHCLCFLLLLRRLLFVLVHYLLLLIGIYVVYLGCWGGMGIWGIYVVCCGSCWPYEACCDVWCIYEACCIVSGTHSEYVAGACISSLWSMSYLAEKFVLVPCVRWPESWSLRPTVFDNNCSLWKYVDVSILVNNPVHRNSFLLFTLYFTVAATLAKSLFLQFQNAKPVLITTDSNCFGCCILTYSLSLSPSLLKHGSRSDSTRPPSWISSSRLLWFMAMKVTGTLWCYEKKADLFCYLYKICRLVRLTSLCVRK
jgi:hypothetical protein